MNQAELVVNNLSQRIADLEKENAILRAELMLANEKLREMETENGDKQE